MTTAVMETETKTRAAVMMPLADLQHALSKIAPAIPGPSATVPVLKNIRFQNIGGKLSLSATNLEMAMSVGLSCGADENVGQFLVSSERLVGYAKLLEGDVVEIKTAEKWATLHCGRSRTKLPLDQMANYPTLNFELGDEWLECEQAVLGRMIRATGFAVSDEESRHILNGALLDVSENQLRMVATDGHRMAMYTATGSFGEAKKGLLTAALLKALSKVLSDKDGEKVVFGEAGQDIKVRVQGDKPVSISARKLAGQFPKYEAVIPQGAAAEMVITGPELLAAVGRCIAMSDRDTCAVKMTFAPSGIQLKAVDPQAGETDEAIGCTAPKPFEEFSSGFNGHYLAEALKHIKGDATITFAIANAQTAMKITAEPVEGEVFIYIVMPMRVS
jgi:DNA polymerase III subunit beta